MESNGTKQAQHTPGPWQTGARMSRVEARPDGWRVPLCIADCDAENAPEIEAEKVANARLIASAPYMRFLLEDAARMLPTLTGENLTAYARTFSALANAAIAKARGES